MSLLRKVAFNTVIQIGGKVVTAVISLFLVGGIARYLGVEGFGKFAAVFAYATLLSIIAEFGFFNVLIRELAEGKKPAGQAVNNIVTFRALFALIVYLAGFAAAHFLDYPAEVKTGIGIVSLAQFWLTINLTLVAVFQFNFRMDRAVFSDIAGRLVTLAAVLWLIKTDAGLFALLSAYILGNMINLALSFIFVRPYTGFRLELDTRYCRRLFRQTVPLGILSIISYLYFHVDMIILSLMKGATDTGIYGAAYKILDVLIMIPAVFVGVVFPVFTRYYLQKNQQLIHIFQQSFDFLLIVGLPVALGVFLTAKTVVVLIAGNDFAAAAVPCLVFFGRPAAAPLILQILIFALFLSFFSQLFNTMIIAAGRQNDLLLPNSLAMVLNIILNLIFIPRYSYLAAALITVLSEAAVLFFAVYATRRRKIGLPTLTLLPKTFTGAAAMGAAFLLLKDILSPFLAVFFSGAVYFLILYLLGGIQKDVFYEIFSFKKEGV